MTTLAPEDITTQKVLIQTTTLAEIKIQCLNNSCNDPQVQRIGKKELDNPSKIIDLHKDDENDGKASKSHEVSGRKGVDPSTDVVTEMTQDHVQDLHNLKEKTTTTMTSTTTSTTTTSSTTTGAPEIKADEALDK